MGKRLLVTKRAIAIVLMFTMIFSFCSCGSKNAWSRDEFEKVQESVYKEYSFSETEGEELLSYNTEKLKELQIAIKAETIEYGYDELFDYETAMQGIRVDHTVAKHEYSGLDEEGQLTAEHLFEIVQENNEAYLSSGKHSMRREIDKKIVYRICEIVVEVVKYILEKYPDIDKDRVYCNLGYLKILEKASAINYGAIEPGMVLHVNKSTAALLDAKDSANMYNVIAHETMHIIQFGCSCEQIDGCDRRCGLAHIYENDWQQQYSDWMWLADASAERLASLYIQTEPMTYFNSVNYIRTLDLVNVLRDEIPANFLETVYFYDDIDKLFYALDAETEEEKQEAYKLVYALEIMQVAPEGVTEAYKKIYGAEWTEEVSGEVFNKIKRPILKTVTKKFYDNLAEAIMAKEITKNDLMFMINLYESTINQHLNLSNNAYNGYNTEFVPWYKSYRNMLFDSFENLSLGEYMNYSAGDGESIINATLNWVPAEKMALINEKYTAHKCQYIMK